MRGGFARLYFKASDNRWASPGFFREPEAVNMERKHPPFHDGRLAVSCGGVRVWAPMERLSPGFQFAFARWNGIGTGDLRERPVRGPASIGPKDLPSLGC